MKIAIDFVGGKLTANHKSHKNGWAHMRAEQLSYDLGVDVDVLHNDESWDDYDIVYLYHGMEFKGALNLFGGATEKSAKYFERLVNPNCKLISLDVPMPDYGELCRGRLKSCDDYWRDIDWNKVSETCKNITEFYDNCESSILTLGDSHSFSAWKPGSMMIRKDGRTLKGVLRKTIQKEIEDHNIDPGTLSKLTLYYGNIDIRHHIMREEDPSKSLCLLLNEYVNQIKELNVPNIELVSLLPIEDETRRLPKTGQFEGTNFYGSREERIGQMNLFNNILKYTCKGNNWDFYEWPAMWYKMDPIAFMKEKMESNRSVHLAPEFHRTQYWKSEKTTNLLI